MMSAQTLLETRDAKPDACTDTFTMIHSVLDEVVMREQAGARCWSKLLAVVVGDASGMRCLPDSKPAVTDAMIYHWENICIYTRQMERKEICLLNYLHIEKLTGGSFSEL